MYENSPRVYVGTYAKYNRGSINGAWLDLDDYSDDAEFYAAALALHSDEKDPELMFQDYSGFPETFYSESKIDPALWTKWIPLDEEDRAILEAYQCFVSDDGTMDDARDAYAGEYKSKLEFVYDFVDNSGVLHGVPDEIARYFDFDAYARDLFIDGFVWANGHVFSA